MNPSILYLPMVAVFTISSCQEKIRTSIPINDTTDVQTVSKMGNQTPPVTEGTRINDFTLQIESKVFDAGSIGKIKLTLTNNSNETIMTGEHYFIEYSSGGSWKRIQDFDELVFIDIGYNIAPTESREFEINLKATPYNFVPGIYRVGKKVITSDKKQQNIMAEFEVQKSISQKSD